MTKRGKGYTAIGLLLLAAALALTVSNLRTDAAAGTAAETVLEQLAPDIREQTEKTQQFSDASPEESYTPDYLLDPERAMPEQIIDGEAYIGVLRIPSLSLELPVISDWSYPSLRKAPCRYTGSAYLHDLVIAAHNYSTHFGRLEKLTQGDEVTFTDVDGNVFRYEVAEIEILSPFAVEEMTDSGWDLTLFTCTIGGRSRVTVRCALAEARQ